MQNPTHVFFGFFGTLVQCSKGPRGDDHRASYRLGGRGVRLVGAFRDAYLEEWSRGVTFIPELGTMLDDLVSRCRPSVASNTHHAPLVTGLLRGAGIAGAFSTVVTSVEFGRRTPCRTIYEHALAVAGSTAGSALFVGDSFVPDYAGPRAVGMQSLLIDPRARAPVPVEHRLAHVLDVRERVAAPREVILRV